jgi:hypothetical protein
MKTTPLPNQNDQTAQRLFSAVAAVALLACLFVTGCASSQGGKSSNQVQARLTVLSGSIEPLRLKFNADKDKLRARVTASSAQSLAMPPVTWPTIAELAELAGVGCSDLSGAWRIII